MRIAPVKWVGLIQYFGQIKKKKGKSVDHSAHYSLSYLSPVCRPVSITTTKPAANETERLFVTEHADVY